MGFSKFTFEDLYRQMRRELKIPKRTFIRHEGCGIEKLRLWHTDGRMFEYDNLKKELYPTGEMWKHPDPPKVVKPKTGHPKCRIHQYYWKDDAPDILRERMDELDMKIIDVSAHSGIDRGTVSRYLSGKQIPRLAAGEELCAVLNLDIEDLYEYRGEVDSYVD